MIIEREQKNILSNRFPDIDLSSYYQINHNKVAYYDLCIAIPQGKKCFLWFTYILDKNVCLMVEFNKSNEIDKISMETCQFNGELSLGTIFYGTCIIYNNNKFFSAEDVFFYKGLNVSNLDLKRKLLKIQYIFEYEINQTAYLDYELIVTIPFMSSKKDEVIEKVKYLPYDVYHIQYRNYKNNKVLNTVFNQNKTKLPRLIFKVKPRIKSDLYEIYCFDFNGFKFHDVAYIPSYKLSVYLNNLFRNIKENKNLDYLEESDDEEIFQNIEEDKYVNLNKEVNMICEYNFRFKKWTPIKLTKERKICNKKQIKQALIIKS